MEKIKTIRIATEQARKKYTTTVVYVTDNNNQTIKKIYNVVSGYRWHSEVEGQQPRKPQADQSIISKRQLNFHLNEYEDTIQNFKR